MAKKEENVYDKHRDIITKLLRTRYICPTYFDYADEDREPDGEPKFGAKKKEYYRNEDCPHWCEYCMGWRYNEFFYNDGNKPSEDEINEYILKEHIKCDLAEKEKRKKYNEILNNGDGEQHDGQLITLCIDKDYKQVPKLALEIISVIRNTNYSFIEDGYACVEVHGSDGAFNPHIHIVTKKVKRNGVVAQNLRRKFQVPKYQIYRVDVKELPYNIAWDYVGGTKTDVKLAQSIKDIEWRKENGIESLYEL